MDDEASLRIGGFELRENLRHWMNDGLMALFFFVVGLEIKTEFVEGELADRHRAALPVAAATGGIVVPAALYAAANLSGGALQGWGVPVATDIAFGGDAAAFEQAKLGIFAASLVAASVGILVLRKA